MTPDEIPYYGDLSLEELADLIYERLMDDALIDVLEAALDRDDYPEFVVLKTALQAIPYVLVQSRCSTGAKGETP